MTSPFVRSLPIDNTPDNVLEEQQQQKQQQLRSAYHITP